MKTRPAGSLALQHLGAALVAATLACAGCTDDTTTTTDTGPTGTPTLAIVSPKDGDCVAIGADPDASVPIMVEYGELYLRPPGLCGDVKQCGHLVLYANGVERNRGAASVIDLPFRDIAVDYGEFTVDLEVLDDAENPVEAGDAGKLSASVKFTTKATCSDGSGGGGGSGGGSGGGGGGSGGGGGGSGGG